MKRGRMAMDGRYTGGVVVALVAALALAVRAPFFGFESWDYTGYVGPWYGHIEARGFARALGEEFSNYTPPYLYLLGAAVAVPVPQLLAVKLISVAFDLVMAAGAAGLAARFHGTRSAGAVAFAAVLFVPTVVLNSAKWGQVDAAWAGFVLLALWALLRGRPNVAVLLLGVAFAFKVQAVFVLPAFAVFTLRGMVPWRSWALFPVPYLLAIVPAWLFGRPLVDLLLIYRDQSGQYPQLTLNAPSLYAWLPDEPGLARPGLYFGATVIMLAVVALWRSRAPLTAGGVVAVATLFAILCPFVLPHMHERYFYLADVLAVVYAICFPARWYVPVLVVTASFYGYWPFLYGGEPVPMAALSLLMLAALCVTAFDLVRLGRSPRAGERPAVRTEAAPVRA
ncbi:MAG: hypothetical protein IT303_05065 [Dehalococcoidia bacterium]|nr:hypothetical protein [Dehalococcoidia bacterium]